MTPPGALEIVWPTLCLVGYASLVGLGVRALLSTHLALPRSLGITLGIGGSVTVVSMALSYRLLGDVMLPVAPLAIVAFASVLIQIKRFWRDSFGAPIAFSRRIATAALRIISPSDLIAVAAAGLVILPVAGFGLTSWTLGTNDFPSYASSAQIWTPVSSESLDFSVRHPDAFGAGYSERAGEKPMATPLLVLTSRLSGVAPYRLLTPVMSVLVFILISSLLVLCGRVFKLGLATATAVVLIPTFSVVPMSRVYDAQLGQVAAVALLACLLAIVATAAIRRTWLGQASLTVVAALVAAAALGSNFTLVLGSAVTLVGLAIWLVLQNPCLRERLAVLGASALLAAAISAPLFEWYVGSFRSQTTGLPGFNVPLASPLAAIGQQASLFQGSLTATLLWWSLVVAILTLLIWVRRPAARWERMTNSLLVGAVLVNAVAIGTKFGWNNYAVHKWTAVFIALVMPAILAYGISTIHGRWRIAAQILLIALATSSIAFSLRLGFAIPQVISGDLLALENSGRIAALNSVNVNLENIYENSIAPLLLPARTVTVTQATYAQSSPPARSKFLIHKDYRKTDRSWVHITKLNKTYALADRNLELDANPVLFDRANAASRRFLYGKWRLPEDWGTGTSGDTNYVVFDLPPEYRTGDVILRLKGRVAAQTLAVFVNDAELMTQSYSKPEWVSLSLAVPHQLIEADGGRLTVKFQTGDALPLSEQGSKAWSLGLASLEVAKPAEGSLSDQR